MKGSLAIPSPVDRRTFLQRAFAVAVVTAASSCSTAPSSMKRMPVVGFFPHDLTRNMETRAAFLDELRHFGYVDGDTIKIEWRMMEEAEETAYRVANELLALGVDVLVANGGPTARAASRATRTTPIVFLAPFPVETGLVTSISRPGGNVTGVARLSAELTAKRLELLKELAPNTSKVAVLGGDDPDRRLSREAADQAARALNLEVLTFEVRDRSEVRWALDSAASRGADAVLALGILGVEPKDDDTIAYAAAHRIPASYANARWVDAGGLMYYGPHGPDQFRLAGNYVARILNGAYPAEMPIEPARKFELIINVRAAKELGLAVPAPLLGLATRVIE